MPLRCRRRREFLRWLADDNFTFLGYREYEVTEADGEEVLRAVEPSGMGILHKSERSLAPRSLRTLAAQRAAAVRFHRRDHPDQDQCAFACASSGLHGLRRRAASSTPTAGRWPSSASSGLFSSNAYMARPQDVPLVRQKFEA